MVTIVTPGDTSQRRYPMKCKGCKASLIFEHDEGRHVSDPRDGDARVFTCPTCSTELWATDKPRLKGSW